MADLSLVFLRETHSIFSINLDYPQKDLKLDLRYTYLTRFWLFRKIWRWSLQSSSTIHSQWALPPPLPAQDSKLQPSLSTTFIAWNRPTPSSVSDARVNAPARPALRSHSSMTSNYFSKVCYTSSIRAMLKWKLVLRTLINSLTLNRYGGGIESEEVERGG